MATRIKINGGIVLCVYDDRFIPLLEALGTVVIERASDVEYDPATKEWQARYRSGEVIASGPNRNEVIKQEVSWIEQKL